MEHVLFFQKIRKGKRNEYIKAHREMWTELLEAIKEAGIEREIIWLKGNGIFLYIMSDNFDKALSKLAEKKVFQNWLKKMAPLLSEVQDYSGEGNIVKLDKIFDLEKQLNDI
ncbi:MAG: L-rhamnose mutarotase [Actinobacteria bacterium]|nr:L-rhamnose mutarotase [Actinomycetota bacterium]